MPEYTKITVGKDGVRRGTYIGANNKVRVNKLCTGKDNTCIKEIKNRELNKCAGCVTGYDKTQFIGRRIGEEFEVTKDGVTIRYKRGLKESKQYCRGDNNTCTNFREIGELCRGHTKGTARIPNAGLVKNEVFVHNDIRYKFNGIQKVKVCNYVHKDGQLCTVSVTNNGFCKKHCIDWLCNYFEGESQCDKIRTHGYYCKTHENGVLNQRNKSQGETKLCELLTNSEIEYDEQYVINPQIDGKTKTLYVDFYIPELSAAIEYDGIQHFEANEYWGGDDGLINRKTNDQIKDAYLLEHDIKVLRIAYTDYDDLEYYLDTFLILLMDNPPIEVYTSSAEMYSDRKYVQL